MGISADNLNSSQRAYIESDPNSNSRLLAPAGCGKTMTLLFRAEYLVKELRKKGVSQPKILIATFTNPAKNELIKKASDFGFDVSCLDITTLNSWGTRILDRNFYKSKTYTDSSDEKNINIWWKYTIIETLESQDYYSDAFDEYENLKKALERPYKNKHGKGIQADGKTAVFEIFDGLKSLGLPLNLMKDEDSFWEMQDSYEKNNKLLHSSFREAFLERAFLMFPGISFFEDGIRKYHPYDQRMTELIDLFYEVTRKQYANKKSFIFSFEDQKYYPLQMLYNDSLDFEPYHYIFVDEFQDINALDFNLIREISRYSKEKTGMGLVSVVGDADQAIFEWRDAVPEYIVNCSKYLDSLDTFQLTINYRSPANIVNMSQNLIAHNKVSYERQRVVPANSATARIEIIRGEDVGEISRSLIPHLRDLLNKGKAMSQQTVDK